MSNHKAVKRYNEIVKEQFNIHNMKKRLDTVDKLTRICGWPELMCIETMSIKLYKQMDDMRIHAENKYQKIMTLVSDSSSQIQHWYDRIHAYLALLRLQESDGKYSNPSNMYRFAKNSNIKNPKELTKEELSMRRSTLLHDKTRRR